MEAASFPPPLPEELQIAYPIQGRPQLGSLLLRDGVVSLEQLEECLLEKEANGGRLGEILLRHGFATGAQVAQVLAEQHGLEYYRTSVLVHVADVEEKPDTPTEDVRDGTTSGPAIKLANQIIAKAIEDGASDIHFEPQLHSMVVRARIDGVMRRVADVPKVLQPAVTSRLKIMGEPTSQTAGFRRTAACRSGTAARRSISASRSSPRPTASRSCFGSSTARPAG